MKVIAQIFEFFDYLLQERKYQDWRKVKKGKDDKAKAQPVNPFSLIKNSFFPIRRFVERPVSSQQSPR